MILVDLHRFTREFQDGAGAPIGNDNASKGGGASDELKNTKAYQTEIGKAKKGNRELHKEIDAREADGRITPEDAAKSRVEADDRLKQEEIAINEWANDNEGAIMKQQEAIDARDAAKAESKTEAQAQNDSSKTSTADADSYAKNNLGVNANYGKIDGDSAMIYNQAIGTTTNDFPKSKEWVAGVDDKVKTSWGKYNDGTRTVSINSNISQSELDAGVKTGFHPQGCASRKATVDHELGHALDTSYGISNSKEFSDIYNKYSKDDISGGLSQYGSSNRKEFLAEAWAEYNNNPNPRPMATEIGNLINGNKGR